MSLLRIFFDEFSENSGNDFSQEWKSKTGVMINDQPLSSFFACQVYPSISFDDGEDEDNIPDDSLRGRNFADIFFELGLPELDFQKLNYKKEIISDEYPIGWALWHRDIKVARHAIFEIGDDEHHVRIDIKDCFNGDPLDAQIDQIVIWDKKHRYTLPLNAYGDSIRPYTEEDVIGTVDIATQALSNGDDRQAYEAFKDLHRIIDEWRLIMPNNDKDKLSVTHKTP